MKKTILVATLCAVITAGSVFAAEKVSKAKLKPEQTVLLKADRCTYDTQSQTIVLTGNAKLQSGVSSITGNKIVITQPKVGAITVSGNVKIKSKNGTIKASAVTVTLYEKAN